MEHLDIYINVAVLVVAAVAAYIVATKSGKQLDIMALAVKLVTDAEVIVKQNPGESYDAYNKRKLNYVIREMQPAFPGLDLTLICNLIERAVDIIKHYPAPQPLTTGITSEGQERANEMARKDLYQ